MKKHSIVKMSLFVGLVALLVLASGCTESASGAPPVAQAPQAVAADAESLVVSETSTDAESAATATPMPAVSGGSLVLTDVLPETYADALSARNQLALGALRLEGGEHAITPAQAQELLLYWQALKALGSTSTTAGAETTAVQVQILEALTPEQLAAIASMQLTNADLDAFYVEQGYELTTPEPGVTPQAGRGRNSGLSQEEREAARAEAEALGTPVGTGSGGSGAARRDVLLDVVIALLETRAQG